MSDDSKIIERLTRLEERLKGIPNLIGAQISASISKSLEGVLKEIRLSGETMANEIKETNKRVTRNEQDIAVLKERSEDSKSLRGSFLRYAVMGFVALLVAAGILISYIQTLP